MAFSLAQEREKALGMRLSFLWTVYRFVYLYEALLLSKKPLRNELPDFFFYNLSADKISLTGTN